MTGPPSIPELPSSIPDPVVEEFQKTNILSTLLVNQVVFFLFLDNISSMRFLCV